jgi:pimeloyl-ACP methyl ester carboxylesterase
LLFPQSMFASDILIEEFDGQWTDENNWVTLNNALGLSFPTGQNSLRLSAPTGRIFAYTFSKNPFPDENITMNIRFKFLPSGLNFGAGILISDNAPITEISEDPNDYATIKIWPLSNNSFRLMSNLCPEQNPSCSGKTIILDVDDDTFLDWHNLSVNFDGNSQYHVSLDDQLLFSSVTTTRRPRQIMLGSPEATLGVTWPIFEVDYVRVTSESSVAGKVPVVVLPGMGASWDFSAILDGGAGSNWAIPDFVNVYDNLISSFENDGYVVDTDLFVFGYDWRKNLDTLADDLDTYIEGLVTAGKIGSSDKVNFVGHSMGGLVARSYLQKHGIDKTNKLVTAGSPHLGAVDTYSIWQGATVINRPWWQKSAIEILTRLNRQTGENKVTTIRRLVPAVKDLLPVYDFLKLNGVLKPWGSLAQQNNYLDSIRDVSAIDGVATVMAGTGIDTKHEINAITRTYKDVMAGKWEDGKISSFNLANGDGTVWLDSSVGGFTNEFTLATDHSGVISSELAIKNIFSELGLDADKVVTNTSPDMGESVLAVVLRSPGTLEVCEGVVCNSSLGWYYPSYKLFLLPGYTGQMVDIKIVESGLGSYNLHVGELSATDEKWRKIEGELKNTGQEDSYQASSVGNELVITQSGATAKNGLGVTVGLLEIVEPGWDTEDGVSTVLNEGLSILDRLKAARKIRYALNEVVKNAYMLGTNDTVEKALRVWLSLDIFMENLLTNDSYLSADQVSRSLQAMPFYKQEVEAVLMSSSSYYAGEFLAEADRQMELAEALGLGQETLRLDKLHSARYLYLLSLGVRN